MALTNLVFCRVLYASISFIEKEQAHAEQQKPYKNVATHLQNLASPNTSTFLKHNMRKPV